MPTETAPYAGTRDRLEAVAVRIVVAARRAGKTDQVFRELEALLGRLETPAPATPQGALFEGPGL